MVGSSSTTRTSATYSLPLPGQRTFTTSSTAFHHAMVPRGVAAWAGRCGMGHKVHTEFAVRTPCPPHAPLPSDAWKDGCITPRGPSRSRPAPHAGDGQEGGPQGAPEEKERSSETL